MKVGTTCKNLAYHPYGIGLSVNEKTKDFQFMFESIKEGVQKLFNEEIRPTVLQADSAVAITNGFENCFNYDSDSEYTRLNCWAHIKRNSDKRMVVVKEKETKDKLSSDINCI